MVTTQVKIPKDSAKIPASKVARDVKPAVSPTPSPISKEDELLTLRARNKVLSEALESIHQSASDEIMRRFDLVWYAKYRYRFPNHPESNRIDEEHKEEIAKLRGDDGDYHHGFNTGLLAAARLFKEQADCLHVNNFEAATPELMALASKHKQKRDSATQSFPHTEVTNNFPK